MISPSDVVVMAGHVTAEIYDILVMILSSSRASLFPVYYRFPFLILWLMMINYRHNVVSYLTLPSAV